MLRLWGTSDCPKMIDIWLEILQHVYKLSMYMYMTMHTLQKTIFIMCIYRLYMYLSMNRKKHRFLWKIHGVPLNVTLHPHRCQEIANVTFTAVGTCGFAGNGVVPFRNSTLTHHFWNCVVCSFFLAWISWVGQNAGKHHFASSECQLDLKVESCWNGGWFFSTWKRTRFLCWVTVHWTIGRKKGRC